MDKQKLVVSWEKYISIHNTEFIDYIANYRNRVMDIMVDNLIKAHLQKEPSLVLFRFSKTTIVTVAYLSDYEVILKRLMDICKRVELYENCAKIHKHFKSLQKKTKPSSVTRTLTT